MKLPMKLSISRPSYGDGRRKINLTIQDDASRVQFVDLEINLEHMMEALTGLSHCPCEVEVRGLAYVGKTKVTERREIVCPLKSCKTEDLRRWLVENAQEDGWILDSYLGSQGSTASHSEGTLLRYNVYKFVATQTDDKP
jgi:hypothetical protein